MSGTEPEFEFEPELEIPPATTEIRTATGGVRPDTTATTTNRSTTTRIATPTTTTNGTVSTNG